MHAISNDGTLNTEPRQVRNLLNVRLSNNSLLKSEIINLYRTKFNFNDYDY